jgi:hypothetical protein
MKLVCIEHSKILAIRDCRFLALSFSYRPTHSLTHRLTVEFLLYKTREEAAEIVQDA